MASSRSRVRVPPGPPIVLAQVRAIDRSGRSRNFAKIKCDQCDVEFLKPTRFLKDSTHHFCSKGCSQLFKRKRIQANCASCNCLVERPINKMESKTGLIFCSKACKDKEQFLGGVLVAPHTTSGVHDYRNRAFAFHGRRCQRCGYDKDEKMLDAHHKDGNRANCYPDNLEVCCVWCHALETRGVVPHNWDGAVAQSGERDLCKVEAVGS